MKRKRLYKLFNEKGFKVGAEIGVHKGKNAARMFKCIPGLKLYLVDSWTFKEVRSGEGGYVSVPTNAGKKYYRQMLENVAPYDAVIIKKMSVEASFEIPDGSLDFVYIDANHEYNFVMLDKLVWVPKVRKGGIVSGHDYKCRWGVRNAVNDYTTYHRIDLRLSSGDNWYWEVK